MIIQIILHRYEDTNYNTPYYKLLITLYRWIQLFHCEVKNIVLKGVKSSVKCDG